MSDNADQQPASDAGSSGATNGPTGDAPAAQPTSNLPPAGWYADPDRPGDERWWDGASWGDQRRAAGGAPPAPSQPQPVDQPRTNGKAVAALVLGIVWIGWLGSILAIFLGRSAKREIKASNGTQTGRGLAIAGQVLGWIGIATAVIFVVLLAAGVSLFNRTQDEVWNAAARLELSTAASAQETYHANTGSYATDVDDLRTRGYFSLTSGVELRVASADASTYCLEAESDHTGDVFHYASQVGEVEPGGC